MPLSIDLGDDDDDGDGDGESGSKGRDGESESEDESESELEDLDESEEEDDDDDDDDDDMEVDGEESKSKSKTKRGSTSSSGDEGSKDKKNKKKKAKKSKAPKKAIRKKKATFLDQIDTTQFQSSTKIEALLHEIRSQKADDKVLVFSQFIRFLELIEFRLKQECIACVKLTGALPMRARNAIISDFHTKGSDQLKVLLISLKAGGEGLNLQR